jgi:hypothetical protein
MTQLALNPATPVLLRPDESVQIGWDPRRALVVRPPAGLTAAALATLLRDLQSGSALSDVHTAASRLGVHSPAAVDALLAALRTAGLITAGPPPRTRSASIRVHGRGPLSDLISAALRHSSARVQVSTLTHAAVDVDTDLVVLTDFLIADPRLVRQLHVVGAAHLPVRVRDGVGLVGPLVIPGATSCLGCADLHRCDRDADWPAVAAQLRNTVGTADRATVLATAALALHQIDRVIAAVDGGAVAAAVLDTTLEFDVGSGTVLTRQWSRHPRCDC